MPILSPRRLSLAVCLLLTISPAMVRAQFQQPTDDELKMTADPKAPGAAAVYLYREDITDDHNNFHGRYERIKVLTEKGKEYATIHVPYLRGYDTVTDIQARTIHADGSIVTLNAKPADLMDYKGKGFQVNTVVFTLPAVEVGSILEYRLKVRAPDHNYNQPTWHVQDELFCHKAHFTYRPYVAPGYYIMDETGAPANRLMYAQHLGPNDKVAYSTSSDVYTLDLTDVPAVPSEDWMPPLNTINWRVEFYYTSAASGGIYWENAGKSWAKRSESFISPTGPIKAAAAQLVASSDTDEQKARKLYAAVEKLDNTSFSRTRSDAERKRDKLKNVKKAEDVWREQSGTDDEITLLYISLARAAGLKAWPAQVVNRDRAIFDSTYLSTQQLDDYLAFVELNGKDMPLDPGQKLCPFGLLAWKHTLASGMRLTPSGATGTLIPGATYKDSALTRVANLSIDSSGQVSGSVRYIMKGIDAMRWRQLTLRNDQDEVKKQFDEDIRSDYPDGMQADFDHFLALDEPESNLIAFVKVSGVLGTATGKHFILPGLLFESRSTHPFVSVDKRSTPVDVHYAKSVQDDVTYNLPPGFTVESAPEGATIAWPQNALLKIAAKKADSSVEITRILVWNFALLDSKTYPDLHGFYQKVATADQQQLVLSRTPAAKAGQGN